MKDKEKKKINFGCGPVFIGVLLILMGIGILYGFLFNAENDRDMRTIVENELVVLDTPDLLPENNGKLVLINGFLSSDDTKLEDPFFGISVVSPQLSRVVQMYQWEESEYGSSNDREYRYRRVWSTHLISSKNFYYSSGHTNPTEMPYERASWRSSSPIYIGNIALPDGYRSKLSTNASVGDLPAAPAETGLGISGDRRSLYDSNPNGGAQIGDVLINFAYLDLEAYGEISIMGWQAEDGSGLLYDEAELQSLDLNKLWTTPMSKEQIMADYSSSSTSGIIIGICISALFILCGLLLTGMDGLYDRPINALKRMLKKK